MRLLPLLTIATLLSACDSTVGHDSSSEVESLEGAVEFERPVALAPATPLPVVPEQAVEPVEDPEPMDEDEDEDEDEDTTGEDTSDTSEDTDTTGDDAEADAAAWEALGCAGIYTSLAEAAHERRNAGYYDEAAAASDHLTTWDFEKLDLYDTVFEDMLPDCMLVASEDWLDGRCFGYASFAKKNELSPFYPSPAGDSDYAAAHRAWYESVTTRDEYGNYVYPSCSELGQ